jgi:UDP-N-acetylmuramoyl-L-alanyl-D-glutamate--2,6-diaminopimelate ligase
MPEHSRDPGPPTPAPRPRPLGELLRGLAGAAAPPGAADTPITGITADSRSVRPGQLFVAIRGTRQDGHAFAAEAVRRGAAAVLAEHDVAVPDDIPIIRVPDSRRALAQLAAAWHHHPARRLTLIGVTGTIGKTSVVSLLQAILEAAGHRVGTIGSLGIRTTSGTRDDTGYTVPDPLLLHEKLAAIADEGCDFAIMEVTSHALAQHRVHGLHYALAIFTNLLPLEHEDYHGSFRRYAEAKLRFFDHLRPDAPLVFNADDRAVTTLAHDRHFDAVGCGRDWHADVRIVCPRIDPSGTRFTLNLRRPLPCLHRDALPPQRLPLHLRLLGRPAASNAALAATAALCLGTDPALVRNALGRIPAPPRRMQLVHRGRFSILDDTVAHPESLSALFEFVRRMPAQKLHILFAVRGRRGARINRQLAESLAIWLRRFPFATLVITRAEGAVSHRNRVDDHELAAFLEPLRHARLPILLRDRLDDAVTTTLERAAPGDLVLLLGAQGANAAASHARRWLAAHPDR